jgi:hypothetical protein
MTPLATASGMTIMTLMTNANNIEVGAHYSFTRRDYAHGYLTFNVKVTGIHNGSLSYVQTFVEYPDGSVETSSIRCTASVKDFAAIYRAA